MIGTIYLYNEEGRCLARNRYLNPAHRRYIIEGWKSVFKQKFSDYYLQIRPTINYEEMDKINIDLKKAS